MILIKSALSRALGAAKAESSGAKSITSMGKQRKKKVNEIVSDGLLEGKSIEEISKKLRRSAASTRDKDRDWESVARTETTDAAARGALELIIDLYGGKTKVFRIAQDCCKVCCRAFGDPDSPRLYTASRIPKNLIGAVHPKCKCKPWTSAENPDLLKAMPFSIGMVKKETNGEVTISTGTGRWIDPHTTTARHIIRHVILRTPLVCVRKLENEKLYLCRHGFGLLTDRVVTLIDPRKIGNAEYYRGDPLHVSSGQDFKTWRMVNRYSRTDYVTELLKVLPTVCEMGEYWMNGSGIRHLSDFMGFKTLSDWHALVPENIVPNAIIGKFKTKMHSPRSLVRKYTKQLIAEDDLRK